MKPLRILICPDKFKGTLTALEATQAIAQGVEKVLPNAQLDLCPMADGGEGTAGLIAQSLGARELVKSVSDPLGRRVEARLYASEQIFFFDCSEVVGLWRLAPHEHNPLYTHTAGVGELMIHALNEGAREIWVGLGGSATLEGGCGMARALGARFYNQGGRQVFPSGATLAGISRMESLTSPLLSGVTIRGLADVVAPLTGERGAARAFGPQKGAGEAEVFVLEQGLLNLGRLWMQGGLKEAVQSPYAGAAGGLGGGLIAFTGARLESGAGFIFKHLGLTERLGRCDLVITGEGRLDQTSSQGKVPCAVAVLARRLDVPCYTLAGSVDPALNLRHLGFTLALATQDKEEPVPDSGKAAATLEKIATELARTLQTAPRES